MRITILQTDIVWEDKQANLRHLRPKLEQLRGKTELVILPETFSTGFSMDSHRLAEPDDGEVITTLRRWARELHIAMAGSFIACDRNQPDCPCYNRAFFLTPEGEAYFSNKRHLFRMGLESDHFVQGDTRPIIRYRGWNILLLVCYDLRFPVWSRNVNLEYDLLLYVANWPASRRRVWDVLLRARALENMSYVCGVNRVGADGNGLLHDGGSVIISPKNELLASVPDGTAGSATADLNIEALLRFREKFPVWEDADKFVLEKYHLDTCNSPN
ncbi:MAG: amidohydrolase [Prevotellaceae bacterium]|jgi:predicted amidohydrolase|nr:amidohydrolase [Prevotellaceae bacterium]